MAITTLRFTPYSWRRAGQLSQEKQSQLTDNVSRLLYKVISSQKLDGTSWEHDPDLTWIRSFLDAYLADLAGHVLQCLVVEPTHPSRAYWAEESHSEKAVRNLALQLFRLFVRTSASGSKAGVPFSLPNLVDFIIAYGADYPKATSNTLSEAVSSLSPGLVALYKDELISSLKKSLKNVNTYASSISACKTACIVSRVLKCIFLGDKAGPLVTAFAKETDFIEAMGMAYSTCHLHRRTCSSSPTDVEGQQWFRAKIDLIDSLHALVNFLLQNASGNYDILIGMLTTLSKYNYPSNSHGSASSSTTMTPLDTQSILQDYEYVFTLSQVLTDVFGTEHEDTRVYSIIVSLRELVPQQRKNKAAGLWLAPFIKSRGTVSKSHTSDAYFIHEHKNDSSQASLRKDDKGKGKAVDFGGLSENDTVSDSDLAVSQILDIFPDQPVETIRKYLQHPSFQNDTEKIIAALLEGILPHDSMINESARPSVDYPSIPDSGFKYTKNRHNIWDDVPMDESRLRLGKARDDADALLDDRSFMEQMKADILRRAQETSEDEDEEVESGAYKVKGKAISGPTFLDDVEEEIGVKVVGDGEAASDSDSEDEGDNSEAVPTPETILEMAYIDNPKLFDRDAATRRSTARAELRSQTGWVDEQIEGWKIMLERNPKKDRILQKHEFSGNKPIVAEASLSKPASSQPEQRNSGAGRGHHGRGGRGGGRGRGRGDERAAQHQQGEASFSGDHTWKDKNKARMGNHNRKRGHDKKMARGFGGVVG